MGRQRSQREKKDSGRGKSYSAEYPYGRRRALGVPTRALRRLGHAQMGPWLNALLKKKYGIDVNEMDAATCSKARL